MLLYTVQDVQDRYIDISVLYAKATNVRITLFQIVGREGPTVSTTPPQLDQSNMSLLNLKFKRRKVDSRDSDGKIDLDFTDSPAGDKYGGNTGYERNG